MQSLQIYVNYGTDETELLLVRLTCVLAVLDQKKKKINYPLKRGKTSNTFVNILYLETANSSAMENNAHQLEQFIVASFAALPICMQLFRGSFKQSLGILHFSKVAFWP